MEEVQDSWQQRTQLGCHLTEKGATFKIYAPNSYGMVLEIYKGAEDQTPIFKQTIIKSGEAYCQIEVEGITDNMYYIWRMMGQDHSYSPAVMDPYAKGVFWYQGEWRNLVAGAYHYQTPKPRLSWQQTVIYELHVGHFTHEDTLCEQRYRGTFDGLIGRLPYLKALGITAVELLPIFKWNSHTIRHVNPYTGEKLEDVWGYNTLAFFAVDERYSAEKTSRASLEGLRRLVEAAHALQMEIILDVVYNHSGEGGEDGLKANFKYLAPEIYYKWSEDGKYLNCAGTGNTLNTNHPIVKALIKDSLRYWADEVGIDGFRFDLASILGQDEGGRWLKESLLNEIATDPILSKEKLITESWDAKGSYDVGRMPAPFAEWSDYFRDTVRKFVKGDQGMIQAVIDCFKGKEIFFTDSNKGKEQSIHFITAHDGFTMRDLVTYNQKHNEANGEANRDGHNANCSYNWGVEGEDSSPELVARRQQIMRNLYSLMLLSKGTPMLSMGDELGRTQQGNNNAFCQDSPLVWVNWQSTWDPKLYSFVQGLINLRKTLDYYKQETGYELTPHGVLLKQPDLSYYSRSIACYMEGPQSLYLIANSYCEPLVFELPPVSGHWQQILNTSEEEPLKTHMIIQDKFKAAAYSVCLFEHVPQQV